MAEMWPPDIETFPLDRLLAFLLQQRSNSSPNAVLHNLGIPSEEYRVMRSGEAFRLEHARSIAKAQSPSKIARAWELVDSAHGAWEAKPRRSARRPSKLLVPL